ncbi:ioquinoline 1-oxidoreductase subunit [Cystobacter fuscus]|uniref:Ioquinoline 1-oxidoreductase subunit n=1 Tax=Cystobacter fuscus TaxID=43 RepID=A0A250JAG6_9BACT|nr:Isoquinoline 1-oxidoreductase subunit [Cystobacter fuscus]ATB40462.1 ioquinoline 1-oxidoreductase subunit [Cystobacter fuscus]
MRVLPAMLRALIAATVLLVGCKNAARPPPPPEPAPRTGREEEILPPLRPVSDFSTIADPQARSIALFTEAGRVITHPRCTNCHPADGVPRQGLEQRRHLPVVSGGAGGHGPPGLPCSTCHQAANLPVVGETLRGVPGNPKWALAPAEMAWVGRSLGSICAQLKDPARNGGKDLARLHHHMAEDVLVAWGWNPGPGLQAVPGTQRAFGELLQAWIDTGAHCPEP